MPVDFIFLIAILIFSVIIHEISHGYVAEMLGDPTARLAGRLTLNPMKHMDLWGSFIIPMLLIITKAGFIIGWAKPVPYNPYNLRNARWGEAMVAGAGPLTNILVAILFSILIRVNAVIDFLPVAFVQITMFVIYINLLLAFFNLIPIPPLDGSKIFASILPYHISRKFTSFQAIISRYGFIGMFLFIFLFIFVLWPFFFKFVLILFKLLTGTPFIF